MTVQQDLQKAIAAAESAQGSYLMFANATQDQAAKQMYQSMADDASRHVRQLKDRLGYLGEANPLNQPATPQNHRRHKH